MRKFIEFLLSIIATFLYIIWIFFKFFYLLTKYTFKALEKSLEESYDALDKGF